MLSRLKLILSLATSLLIAEAAVSTNDAAQPRYLAFQIFTASRETSSLGQNFPPLPGKISEEVESIVHAIGSVGDPSRKLGFIVGPLAFDDTDERVRQLMRDSFAIAQEKNVATGFHIDDSMFWDRLTNLNKPENIEWIDWKGTPNTGRRLDWSSVPTKIMPQLCLNSPAVEAAVRKRAKLIGEEALRGLNMLRAHGQANLFIGVVAGWETQMGPDFATGKSSGFHALANEGFSASHPPADMDQARTAIVSGFIDLWSASLASAGVPDDKIFSHTAFMSQAAFDSRNFSEPGQRRDYLESIAFTPPAASFGAHHRPGFSTYPQFGHLEQIESELSKNGNPPWASAEGTAVDPGAAEHGDPGIGMERYLGNLFNRGAVVVNILGWGVGSADNPFRRVAESPSAIAAYQKFLRGEPLKSEPDAQLPSAQFFEKIRKLQKELPPYFEKHGREKVGALYDQLGDALKGQRYVDAEHLVDQIFQVIEG